jgi:xanthine dehydrogenase accessory factor
MNEDFLNAINLLHQKKTPYVVVTLIKVIGSAPQEIGAKMIVGKEGLLFGTVGGGKVEQRAINESKIKLENKKADLMICSWNLQTDIGMTCGGVVDLLFEGQFFESTWKVAIFGAGHVGQEIVKLLHRFNCQLMVIDSREEWLDLIPKKDNILTLKKDKPEDSVLELAEDTFIISVTMGHSFDLPILEKALKAKNFPYVGVIGSESKAIVLKKELIQLGVTSEQVAQLICPIGEQMGTNQPLEIAFSVVCQLIKKRDHFYKI